MFERKLTSSNGGNTPAQTVISLVSENGEPVEFIYNGVRFHINEKLTTWLQTNDWWKKLDQGEVKESVSKYWQVEAAWIGSFVSDIADGWPRGQCVLHGGFSPKVKEQKAPEGVAVIPKT